MIAIATNPLITLSATDVRMLEVNTAFASAEPAAISVAVTTSDGCPVAPPNTNRAITPPTAPVATPTITHRTKNETGFAPIRNVRTP